ncbi:hypothetical protein PSEUDO8O_120048 [Pseudomonas sp. 8O]|nr:hypothetical protein PSEUDO8O_120048 [Pseudomonas sp. 8O]
MEVTLIIEQAHACFGQLQAGEVLAVESVEIGQAKVELITYQSLKNLIAAQRMQLKAQPGVTLGEQTDKAHRVETGQRHHAQAQGTHQMSTAGGSLGEQAILRRQQTARPGQDALTFGAEALETLSAAHQLQAQLVFQLAQAHGQRRLGYVAACSGLTEVAGFVEGDEKFQLLDIHGGSWFARILMRER